MPNDTSMKLQNVNTFFVGTVLMKKSDQFPRPETEKRTLAKMQKKSYQWAKIH